MATAPRIRHLAPGRWRVLLVTFDLTNTGPGDPRYKAADDALAFHGEVFSPVKQLRLVLTQANSTRLRSSLEQHLGRNISLMIIEVRNVRQIHIASRTKRLECRGSSGHSLESGLISTASSELRRTRSIQPFQVGELGCPTGCSDQYDYQAKKHDLSGVSHNLS
ncbi:hypothetical protein FHW17_004010 [Phyllobacterium sp. P30BS-XVII]|nr:hypothetical protein [Phyllobacterium sp. P30BS-XVII]